MKTKRTTVALLTDFGTSDHYIGVMKGVILRRAPHVTLVDISHNVVPQDIEEASYLLWASYAYFPPGTIFVSVVDPGVGTERRVIAVSGDGYYFLAPDNGLLKYILGALRKSSAYAVTRRKYFLPGAGRTFHGRDIFAPVCAYIANGGTLSKLGTTVTPSTRAERFTTINPRRQETLQGHIISIDHFGNLVTDFQPEEGNDPLGGVRMEVDSPGHAGHGRNVVTHFSRTYAEAPEDRQFMIVGSSGLIEISLKNGNAADFMKVKRGAVVTLRTNVR